MASLIEGYNYDIFISYRQKDNKHDGWVTKFVEELKGEFEATFKEDVSVYFDENPHDRLQETHDVDKSLEDKLKCIIFIPVISQTYCDPNCYAWQYELLPFLRMVENDPPGKDVKLRSGNVASRILPVRIHDLEPEDVRLFEKETGNVLRSMDFVFKTSTGVSRPLKTNEDHPQDNINKTFYADQINKVAHSIKEIILAMKAGPGKIIVEMGQGKEPVKEIRAEETRTKPPKVRKVRFLIPAGVVALLIIAGMITYPKYFKQNTVEKLRAAGERICVSVMPFQNLTNDAIKWNDYQYIVQTSLTSFLSNYPEYLQVRQTESVNELLKNNGIVNYASFTPSFARKISQKLAADVFVYGNIIKSGDVIRLVARLIDTENEEVIKSFQVEGPSGEVNFLPVIDTLSGMVKDFLVLTELKKGMGKEQTSDAFYQVTTSSPEAFKYYIYGLNAPDNKSTIEWFKRAISVDSNFVLPYTMVTWNYIMEGRRGYLPAFDSARNWCLKIYKRRDQVPLTQQLIIKSEYAFLFETQVEQNRYLQQILNNDDQQPVTLYMLGENYRDMSECEKAIPALEKGIGIYEKWGIKPSWLSTFYSALLQSYIRTGSYKEGKELVQKYQKDYPNANLYSPQATLAFMEGDTVTGNKYVNYWLSTQKKNSASEESIMSNLIQIYSWGRMPDKVKEFCHKLLSLKSVSVITLNTYSWVMLSDDRNSNEVLRLAEKALTLSPENYTSLHRKGWALYQMGKYEEALEIMQKSSDIRIKTAAPYNHEFYLHLEAAKKAVAGYKNN